MNNGEKNTKKFVKDLLVALAWLIGYFAGMILTGLVCTATGISGNIALGTYEVLFAVVVLCVFKARNRLSYYGIKSMKTLDVKNLLFFIPFILIISVNLWFGVSVGNAGFVLILFAVIAKLGVGFAEEILFRGFWFKALMNKGPKVAIIVSSIMFGVIHMTNLSAGADFILTVEQVFYALAIGFTFSIFVYKTGNIIPCIICHGLVDVTDLFMPKDLSIEIQTFTAAAVIVFAVFYAVYMAVTKKSLVRTVAETQADNQ